MEPADFHISEPIAVPGGAPQVVVTFRMGLRKQPHENLSMSIVVPAAGSQDEIQKRAIEQAKIYAREFAELGRLA